MQDHVFPPALIHLNIIFCVNKYLYKNYISDAESEHATVNSERDFFIYVD